MRRSDFNRQPSLDIDPATLAAATPKFERVQATRHVSAMNVGAAEAPTNWRSYPCKRSRQSDWISRSRFFKSTERLWRSVKYEEVYLKAYDNVSEARSSIGRYLDFYNARRPHSSLDGATPDQAYFYELPFRLAA